MQEHDWRIGMTRGVVLPGRARAVARGAFSLSGPGSRGMRAPDAVAPVRLASSLSASARRESRPTGQETGTRLTTQTEFKTEQDNPERERLGR